MIVSAWKNFALEQPHNVMAVSFRTLASDNPAREFYRIAAAFFVHKPHWTVQKGV
jgi:hypothetical protein